MRRQCKPLLHRVAHVVCFIPGVSDVALKVLVPSEYVGQDPLTGHQWIYLIQGSNIPPSSSLTPGIVYFITKLKGAQTSREEAPSTEVTDTREDGERRKRT